MEYIKGLVSVVMPTYGRSDTLERAINSIKRQTYTDIEILVVDDNEPGSEYAKTVAAMIERLGYDNLHLITQPRHINGAAARNAGIRVAKGEYIAFLDDDDFFMPDKIAEQVAVLENLDPSYGAVSSRKIYIKNNKVDGISNLWTDTDRQNFEVITRKLNVSTCTLLMRRACLDETGYFDEALRRNQEVQLLAFFTAKYKIKFIEKLLTVIDCTDTANRPNSQQVLATKGMFLESVRPVIEQYSKHKQKLIRAHNMIDVLRVYIRERKWKEVLSLAGKTLVYPSVFCAFCQFLWLRVVYRNTKEQLAPEMAKTVYDLIGGIPE